MNFFAPSNRPTSISRSLLTIIAGLSVLGAACSGGSSASTEPPPSTSGGPTPSGSDGGGAGKLPLGELTLTSGSASCAQGGSCRLNFQVDCPDVGQTAQGVLIADGPGGTPKALVVGFIGTRGTGLEGLNKQWVDSMVADGYQVVIVSWANETPWLQSASGDEVGARLLGCRPATAIKWVHDNIYDPMGLSSPATGVCGFCLTGNSGGASQIAYSLSFYGIAGMVDAAVLSGGPPHAGLDQGCLGSDPDLAYDQGSASLMDLSYGFLTPGTGPCAKHDQSFADRFKEDSVDVGGTYKFPDTRMSFLFVAGDHTSAPPHGMLYYDKVKEAGTPMVQVQEVPGQSHTIMISPEGRQAVEDELTAGS